MKVSTQKDVGRRSFLKRGVVAAGAATLSSGFLVNGVSALGEEREKGRLSEGDAAILRFLAAAEILESDLWEQYWELSSATGVNSGFASPNPATGTKPTPTGGNAAYTAALQILDGDMPQYINDNTDDEFSHANFLLAYLKSRGANTAELALLAGTHFRTLAGSAATGSAKKGRLTNLTQLTIDTSFWGRYRTDDKNPDLGDTSFAQPVPSLNVGKHAAIPRTDADSNNADLINAIAFTAGFHFCFIEQGGSSLYPTLALKVTNLEVLQILLSIGPTETSHFQTWHDKAGNAFTSPNNVTDGSLTFNVSTSGEDLQTNLIMPEPCPFLSRKFPVCSIIRPVSTDPNIFGAMAAVKGLTADGLFIGQTNNQFFTKLHDLAEDADEATRKCHRED